MNLAESFTDEYNTTNLITNSSRSLEQVFSPNYTILHKNKERQKCCTTKPKNNVLQFFVRLKQQYDQKTKASSLQKKTTATYYYLNRFIKDQNYQFET